MPLPPSGEAPALGDTLGLIEEGEPQPLERPGRTGMRPEHQGIAQERQEVPGLCLEQLDFARGQLPNPAGAPLRIHRLTDQAVIERCREQIADIAAVPVLNLHDKPGMANAAEQRSRPGHRRQPRAVASIDHHEVARLPWERRAKRQARRAEREAASVA